MKKRWIILLGFLGVLVLVAAVVLFVAERRFGAVRTSPVVSYETEMPPGMRACVLLDTSGAQAELTELVLRLTPPGQAPPGWIVGRVLPHSLAAMFDVDERMSRAGMTVFVNERRLGPVLTQQVNASLLESQGTNSRLMWAPEGMTRKRRGVLLLTGSAPIAPEGADLARAHWPEGGATAPLRPVGGHLLELTIDNRDGGLVALMGAMGAIPSDYAQNAMFQMYFGGIRALESARATADFADPSTLSIQVTFDCNPAADDSGMQTMQFILDTGVALLRNKIELDYGARLEGSSQRDGARVVGTYRLSDIDNLIAQIAAG